MCGEEKLELGEYKKEIYQKIDNAFNKFLEEKYPSRNIICTNMDRSDINRLRYNILDSL